MTQLALFEMPVPPDRRHDWMVRPVGPNECSACQLLWFSDASRADVIAFLGEDCPVKLLDAPEHPFTIVYLT
jgi:hypothetical protein